MSELTFGVDSNKSGNGIALPVSLRSSRQNLTTAFVKTFFCFADDALKNTLAYWNSDERYTFDKNFPVSETGQSLPKCII